MQDFCGSAVGGDAIGCEKITYLNGVSAEAGTAQNIEIVAMVSVLRRSR
jgi:hypothetical protein